MNLLLAVLLGYSDTTKLVKVCRSFIFQGASLEMIRVLDGW